MIDNIASLEFLQSFPTFERSNMIRRTSQLNSLVANMTNSFVLPKNVMLHMLDNFSHIDSCTDTFKIGDYPFLDTKNNTKYLHNFVDFSDLGKDTLAKFSHRIFRNNLALNLRNYGMANRKLMIPAQSLETVAPNHNCIIIENYNPLYRVITTNNRPISQYYRYRSIMTTVLKNTTKYDRLHFLVIPVPDSFTYKRSNLLGIAQSGEVTSPRLLSHSHFYFFVIDLVALLLNNSSDLSTLNQIDRKRLSALNIIMINKNKGIIVNIGKLAMLARSKTYVFNFINNISRISGINVPLEQLPDSEVDPGTPDVNEPDENDVNKDVLTTGIIRNNLVANNTTITPSVAIQNIVNKVGLGDARIGIHVQDIHEETKAETERESQKEAHEIDASEIKENKEKIIAASASTTSKGRLLIPEAVRNLAPISDKQAERIEKLSNKYKDIVIQSPKGPQTIHEILREHIDINLKPEKVEIQHAEGVQKDMLESTVKMFDRSYAQKMLRKDILTNVVCFRDNGLFLAGYEEKNDYSSFNRVKYVKASFADVRGKRNTVNFKLPMPDDEGYYLVNGVRLSMSKQLVNIPICKISPTRVSLISNYNKTIVEKVESSRHSLPEVIASKASDLGITIIPKHNSYIGKTLPYDYKQLGGLYSKIITPEYVFYFEYDERLSFGKDDHPFTVNVRSIESPFPRLEGKYGVVVGQKKGTPEYVFMKSDNVCTVVNIVSEQVVDHDKHIVDFLDLKALPSEWCNLKILDKNLPIIFILAYRYGLTTVLTNMNIKHRFVENRSAPSMFKLSPTELSLRFSDGVLIFDRYPLEHSYILSGFALFPTLKQYPIIDFNDKDVYHLLITDRGMSTNYLRGIDNYFSFFIDPITKEVLQEMHEPTNTRDLLIRAVTMLVDSVDKPPSAVTNFRLRSHEKIPAMIYNEISRQYANYINSNYKDVSFSINTEAIFQRLIQDQTMTLREDVNPMHAIKEKSKVTYSGFGGRSNESFVARDRKYPKDAIGILSEMTVDGPSVGMTAALSGNPKIKNLRGMFEVEDEDKLNAPNILSDMSLLMPGLNHDDQRLNVFKYYSVRSH